MDNNPVNPNQNVDPFQPQAPQPVPPPPPYQPAQPYYHPEPQSAPPPSEHKEPRKLKWTYVLIVILAIIVLALLGVFYISQSNNSNSSPTPTPSLAPTSTPTPEASTSADTSDWQKFSGNRPYTFMYPADWDVLTDTNKAMTLVMPQEIADELRGVDINEGSSKLTLEIYDYSSPLPAETFESNDVKEVTEKDVTVNGIASKQYTTIWKQGVPGFSQGDISVSTVVVSQGKTYDISLLKYEYLDIYNSLLETFEFE